MGFTPCWGRPTGENRKSPSTICSKKRVKPAQESVGWGRALPSKLGPEWPDGAPVSVLVLGDRTLGRGDARYKNQKTRSK